jgi:RNA polymerase sigma-70 factor, ECF subfamily
MPRARRDQFRGARTYHHGSPIRSRLETLVQEISMAHQNMTETHPDDAELVPALRSGDEDAYEALTRRYRSELQLHCYRMLGSLHDAEDAVQETFARAWRHRGALRENASPRPWLYRVATNACLDAIRRERRRVPAAGAPDAAQRGDLASLPEVAWLQPYPDAALEPPAPRESEPDAVLVTKETVELAFLTVIQLLTPRQRAVLILRDVLGWSAKETAELLEISVAAVTSSLQRARATLRSRLPRRRPEWPAGADPTAAERDLLARYIEATEQEDMAAIATVIREDAIFRMPPTPGTAVGRDEMIRVWVDGGFGCGTLGRLRCVATRANRGPAVACYRLREGDVAYRPLAMDVLTIEEGLVSEILTFPPDLFESFGLPPELPANAGG